MTGNKLEKLLHLDGWFSWKYDDTRTCKPGPVGTTTTNSTAITTLRR